MRHLLFVLLLAATTAHAAPYSRVLENETREIPFTDLQRVTCEPGENRAHHFPTPSMLIIDVKDLLGGKTAVGSLVLDDDRMGDHCQELTLDLAAKLPGILQVNRTKSESCQEESIGPNQIRAHYITWQEVHGGAVGITLRGNYETILDRYEPDAPCRQ